MLGIILATTTLIAVVSVINGMDLYIADAISNMGADGFRVVRMAMIGNFDAKKFMEMIPAQSATARLRSSTSSRPHVRSCREIGMVANRGAPVRYGTNLIEAVSLKGVTSNMGVITNVQTAMGRFLTDTEDQTAGERGVHRQRPE